jgi:glycosyltransferase involved in cell wall biosynthesis
LVLPRPDWLSKTDCFLYVSFIDHYKAQLEVVCGFNIYRLQGGAGKLLLVRSKYFPCRDLVRKRIADPGLIEAVLTLGGVPHNQLPVAYQHALVNIFASFTENCPNILLKMMVSGRPALVSSWGPMPEFGGEAVDYFDAWRVLQLNGLRVILVKMPPGLPGVRYLKGIKARKKSGSVSILCA